MMVLIQRSVALQFVEQFAQPRILIYRQRMTALQERHGGLPIQRSIRIMPNLREIGRGKPLPFCRPVADILSQREQPAVVILRDVFHRTKKCCFPDLINFGVYPRGGDLLKTQAGEHQVIAALRDTPDEAIVRGLIAFILQTANQPRDLDLMVSDAALPAHIKRGEDGEGRVVRKRVTGVMPSHQKGLIAETTDVRHIAERIAGRVKDLR